MRYGRHSRKEVIIVKSSLSSGHRLEDKKYVILTQVYNRGLCNGWSV